MFSVTIPSGQSLSNAFDFTQFLRTGNYRAAGIQMPDAWTTANLTFFVSVDGVNYKELYDGQGNEYIVTAAAGRYILLDPSVFSAIRFLKIQSGVTGSVVNQGADRVLAFNLQ